MKTLSNKSRKPLSVHSIQGKNFDKLTKKQHIGRELELWGVITGLQLKLKAARTQYQLFREHAELVIRTYRRRHGPLVVVDVMGGRWKLNRSNTAMHLVKKARSKTDGC